MAPTKIKKNKKAIKPLAPPPLVIQSRKKARQVTTLFHKYTREQDVARREGATDSQLKIWDEKLQAIGGREAYQRASQLSTSFHSTSKWVLGTLQRRGWLYGIPIQVEEEKQDQEGVTATSSCKRKKTKLRRRTTCLLEVGAINTELLDAAERTVADENPNKPAQQQEHDGSDKKYRLEVRAIDLHSMESRIEEADFLTLPLPSDENQCYDVIVCSMVINCVTTANDRGRMLMRLYRFLKPGGLCFLTLPKLCLTQSPYITKEIFIEMLGPTGVGFELEERDKESPKVVFFICRRPLAEEQQQQQRQQPTPKWSSLRTIRRGKKFRNQFSVVLEHRHDSAK